MKDKEEKKYFIIRKNTDSTSCTEDGALVEIGNIFFRELQAGFTYVMKNPFVGDYPHAEARLTLFSDSISVTLIGLNEEDAADESKGTTTITFKLELLQLLRENGNNLIKLENESEWFVDFLMKNPDNGGFDLETLIEVIAFELINSDSCGCLRTFDSTYGTSYQQLVTSSAVGAFRADDAYIVLCNFAARIVIEEKVTISYALRQFELQQGGFRSYTVAEILYLAYRTLKQLEQDVQKLIRAVIPCKLGPEYRDIDFEEAMTLLLEGKNVYVVILNDVIKLKKANFSKLDRSHLYYGLWYSRVNT